LLNEDIIWDRENFAILGLTKILSFVHVGTEFWAYRSDISHVCLAPERPEMKASRIHAVKDPL
jgi:hypothetical protein